MVAPEHPALQGTCARLLRIFIGSHDRHHHQPLYEAVVNAAREAGLAGATVLEGCAGFGATSIVHHPNLLRLSSDLPVVIEIIDSPEKVEGFLPVAQGLLHGRGMITVEEIQVLRYQAQPGVTPS